MIQNKINRHFHSFKIGLGLERHPPGRLRTIYYLFDREVVNLLKKVFIDRLDGE